jgi:Icc protein
VRFIHISDTHIAPDPGFTRDGASATASLEGLVEAINGLRFPIDFVLHTGDVAEDRSEGAYRLARGILSRLRLPVHYVAGNHDDPGLLQRVLLGREPSRARLDYRLEIGGIQVAVLDSRGPRDPAGTLTDEQLESLRKLCVPAGPPLVIAIHHPPLPLDTPWLDEGWQIAAGRTPNMLIDRGTEFQDAVVPARERLRGVFFGHVHRAFEIHHRGILYVSAPSGFNQLLSWPDQAAPGASPAEPAGFGVVTVTEDRTIIRQHTIARRLPV